MSVLTETQVLPDEGKSIEQFRNYDDDNNPRHELVKQTYGMMHANQCVQFVREQVTQWSKFDHAQLTILDAVTLLDQLVDDSDPDIDLPNSVHAFQTAERIRELHPTLDWFHLTGLIHDLGKVMSLWGQPQWATVGDIFPVGCEFSPKIVHSDSFVDNPDFDNPLLNTKLGMYTEGCGLDSVMMSWGHDEYMYRVLKHNKCTLPDEAMYMIRYHSFYPWHTAGEYDYLCNEKDRQMLPWVKEFNKFDLYSKCNIVPDVEALKPYYQSLIDKYCPGLLKF